ncbi:MAG: hypothetical protein NC390_04675 [Fusobacterium sp.]|nr:hypothetical protein [Fusobacterium sp.]
MKVVLVGKEPMLCALIEGCMACGGIEIAGVFRYDNLIYPGWRIWLRDLLRPSVENTLIKKYRLRDLKFKSVNSADFKRFLLENNIDLMLVGTWREKIKKDIFETPRLASVNVHPSLLPKYRGPNPYLQTIKNRERFSGFTFHLIDEKFDSGAILYQKRIEIQPYYTSKELREKTVFEVRQSLPEFLVALDKGDIIPQEQSEAHATYYPNITEDEMMLDFERETAEEISARVRALHPWLPCYVTLGEDFYIVNPYEMEIVEDCPAGVKLDGTQITARCRDGKGIIMRGLTKYRK